MTAYVLFALLGIAVRFPPPAGDPQSLPLQAVKSVDLARYCGTWYEIARLPNRFQKECVSDVTATYTLLEDGTVRVVNRCRKANGDTSEAEGKARRKSDAEPASKLEVRFAPAFLSIFPFVWGNYWIIDLAPDYSYAVIGEPSRDYLWVLSRTPALPVEVYSAILERIRDQGYDPTALVLTKQGQ
jgi:apolipoprotein D and lipocalin family protein